MLPQLKRTCTVEPNPDQGSAIASTATALKLENIHYTGAAWSQRARSEERASPNGIFVIHEAQDGALAADALDAITAGETYDYLKLDVEATEREALDGASNLLSRARCIAIAAYHLPNDLLDLPNQVDRILHSPHSWQWGFRHYSQCFD